MNHGQFTRTVLVRGLRFLEIPPHANGGLKSRYRFNVLQPSPITEWVFSGFKIGTRDTLVTMITRLLRSLVRSKEVTAKA
ncbi:hypothetical protein TNCV_1017641 [Trichonephila clavipes]|uniref:Uncharacterized protein n=1 Tax=Trichonephila clavipes TaxID=2585209 RepID=A0A8X6VYC5_TRICX|nr:hypothetical protein TNCV_1017641 [Trichonephila clavipes]